MSSWSDFKIFVVGLINFIMLVIAADDDPSIQLLQPRFLSVPSNITVREGSLAVLPCSVLNLGTKQVTWQKVGDDYFTTIGRLTWVNDDAIIVEYSQKTPEISDWNLIIKNVKPSNAGSYQCQITATEILTRVVQLNVIGPPIHKPGISVHGKEYVERGDTILLECNATGGPHIPEDIDWFKNGDKIDSQKYSNIVVTKYRSLENRALISRLIIDRSTKEDTGTYICRSSLDEINKKTVTVLVADTTNVKRGTAHSNSATYVTVCLFGYVCALVTSSGYLFCGS